MALSGQFTFTSARVPHALHTSPRMAAARPPHSVPQMKVIKAHDPGFILTDPASPDSWGVQVFR